MEKKQKASSSKRELLSRWTSIEEEENRNGDVDDPTKRRRLHQLKEQWFADSFNFLINLPCETHTWCAHWDLMGPLLETFYNYYKDEHEDSALRVLWRRISQEMRQCVQCVSQHHQAQETYGAEYEPSSIGPLLDVLRSLDEERIVQHLKEISGKLKTKEYDALRDNAEVVCLMYEVLMFPILLDDQSLFSEFQSFIEAVDNLHELALAAHQRFPGVYALLFLNRRVRTVGRRLARSMEKIRRATDLEPLQPLLDKFMGFLETEVQPSAFKASRPRAQLERLSVWIGITSLLEFLEAPAFKEGILERYPIFFDIVLNQISGDSAEFSQAVNCLKELFKMLGCKLWLTSTLSPSVMRNTLMGQCFHTRNEKIHKDIFDLFPPFLQSLEALQDGEHEKQRRHFLYFLLHQVPVSSNFNGLTRKLACKIAIVIIHRGYKMNPPCPPFECAHMWGPSLVSLLKDSSLHRSLRQPAFDLVETIIVSDATALVSALLNDCAPPDVSHNSYLDSKDDYDEINDHPNREDKEEGNCWGEFMEQRKITSQEFRDWMCIPMLWIDFLVDIDPSMLPVSTSYAVFWARSHLTLLEPESSAEMALPVRTWLSSSASDISSSFRWKVPTGFDDGGSGEWSRNSVKVSLLPRPLTKSLSRLTAQFLLQMGKGELRNQWTWEPRMAESLILSLMDPNDNVRQFGKSTLEQVSSTRGLASGLKFLCSTTSSLSAMLLGFRHAIKVVQLNSVILKFQTLQHFFFLLRKLIDEGDLFSPDMAENASVDSNIKKYSSHGGFLVQPGFAPSSVKLGEKSNDVDLKLLEKFRYLLAKYAWPSIRKFLLEGKAFIDHGLCQMTCVRVLEILPIVLQRLCQSSHNYIGISGQIMENMFDFLWLHDLVDWGKSLLKVLVVYWKRTILSVLNVIRQSCNSSSAMIASSVESYVSSDCVDIDQLMEKVSRLRVSLSKEISCGVEMVKPTSKGLLLEGLISRDPAVPGLRPALFKDANSGVLDSKSLANEWGELDMVILSDDEAENKSSHSKVVLSTDLSSYHLVDSKTVSPVEGDSIPQTNAAKKVATLDVLGNLIDAVAKEDVPDGSNYTNQKMDFSNSKDFSSSFRETKCEVDEKKELKSSDNTSHLFSSQNSSVLEESTVEVICSRSRNQTCHSVIPLSCGSVINELVRDRNDDLQKPLMVKSVKQLESHLPKLNVSGPKRQVIQLGIPVENRFGSSNRAKAGVKRFKPPTLDDWYRPILQIDYFGIVGLTSARKDEKQTANKLKEVPVCIQSPEEYLKIFRPLVLEEFKAHLQSSFLEMSSLDEVYCGCLSVLSVERTDDFHHVRFVHDNSDNSLMTTFQENDLVLLTKEPPRNSSHDVHMLGKVERRERDNKRNSNILLVRFYFLNGSLRLNQARRLLMERSKWHGSRILNITPQLREFQALSSIKDIPMLPVILKPVADVCDKDLGGQGLNKLSQPLQQILRSSFNDSQLQAIDVAVGLPGSKKDFELSLIQGPPGTGKTRTIVAILSGLLASSHETNDLKKSMNPKQSNNLGSKGRPKVSQSVAIARAWQDAAVAKYITQEVERNEKPMGSHVRRRVLICAQSNAAVDELVYRISCEGLYGSDGETYRPYLVRVGNAKTVHPNSLRFFIDTIVDIRMAEERLGSNDAKNYSSANSSTTLRSNLEKLVDQIRYYEAKRANLTDGIPDTEKSPEDKKFNGDDVKEMSDLELGVKLRRLYEQKKQIFKDLSAAQLRERRTNDETKSLRHKLRKLILKEAEIVVTTLSGCGGDLYSVCSESMSACKFGSPSEQTLFDAVLIDEAAQALEPATLIPLQLLKSNGSKCIMVGDPKQLPATVFSNIASKFLYECSMFERLQRAGHPVTMLTKQYRMHPEICRFPSLHFYDGMLMNGEQMSSKSAPFHDTEGLGPYIFYDIIDGQELRGKNSGAVSLYNVHEAEAAVQLVKFFKKKYPSEFSGGRIGIITPYKSQLSVLRAKFSNVFEPSIIADMEFNTVDGFQGREVDILLLSTVRAASSCSADRLNSSSIGFVADVRRMNVSLTRAKLSLWILGNARTLQTNNNWASLVTDAKERNLVISLKRPYNSFKSGQSCNQVAEEYNNHMEHPDQAKNERCCDDDKKRNKHQKVEKPLGNNRNCSSEVQHSVIENSGGASEKRIDMQSRRRARDEHDRAVKMAPYLDNNVEKVCSKSLDSAISGETATKIPNKHREIEKQLNAVDSHTKKRKDKYVHMKNKCNTSELETDGDKNPKVGDTSNARKKSIEHVSSKPNSKGSSSLAEGNLKLKKMNYGGATSSIMSEDVIKKRKHQREAVEAILNSSLIPSKKQEPSSKPLPVKRPHSPTSNAKFDIRPPKTTKGQSTFSKRNSS